MFSFLDTIINGVTRRALAVVGPDGPAATVPGSSNQLLTQVLTIGTTVTQLNSIPAGTTHIRVQAETQNVRFRTDGNTNPPTTTAGTILYTGQPETIINVNAAAAANIRFVGVAAGAVLNVTYCG